MSNVTADLAALYENLNSIHKSDLAAGRKPQNLCTESTDALRDYFCALEELNQKHLNSRSSGF